MDRINSLLGGARRAVGCAVLGAAAFAAPAFGQGGDVTLLDSTGVANFGVVGGIRGYAIASSTCNVGTLNINWTNNGTPGLGMNVYRLSNGRMMQIGQGWVKTACCAAAGSGCGMTCNGQGGSVLGVGCLDSYGASYNGGYSRLGPRSGINAWTGQFNPLPGGTSPNAIERRIQVAESDLNPATNPGALYFIEGVYVCTNEAQSTARQGNNATYKRVTVTPTTYDLTAVTGSTNMRTGQPAIQAWRDHGGGVGIPDTSVTTGQADIPGEGLFWYASKVRSLGGGQYLYDYAV